MLYQQKIDGCLDAHGIDRVQLETLLAQLAPTLQKLTARQTAAALLNLPAHEGDLADIETLAAEIRKKFKHVVIVGTGGSGLSGKTLVPLATPSSLTFHFLDNADPDLMDDVLARLDVKSACFLVISKSGATLETLSQFYVLREQVEKAVGKDGARERFVVITEPGDSPLSQAASEHGLRVLAHVSDIGGRFAILTNIGLLPAAIAGLDIRALRRGAQTVVAQMDKALNPSECPPAIGAAVQYAFIAKGKPMSVMLPYAEKLSIFANWYRQCWAESLGKDGSGSTAIPAMGTTDQHSQLQLYLDGPHDKLFHLIMLKRAGQGQRIPTTNHPEMAYLKGKTLGDVIAAEQQATLETLVRHGCPARAIMLEKLGEAELGALLMHFMLEVIFTAALLDVDPFNQPAVEEGKKLAREYLLKGPL